MKKVCQPTSATIAAGGAMPEVFRFLAKNRRFGYKLFAARVRAGLDSE
jgi:hypothetical protein